MATKKVSRPKKGRKPLAPRYGIAEWFGKDILGMTPEERQRFGHLAAKQDEEGVTVGSLKCPFLSTLIPTARCNKPSGVCTIRKYAPDGSIVSGDTVVTVCPNRFLQQMTSGKTLFVWISENMLDIANPTIVKETPFLRKILDVPRTPEIAEDMKAEA